MGEIVNLYGLDRSLMAIVREAPVCRLKRFFRYELLS